MAEKETFKIHSIKYNFIMNIILKGSQIIFPLITFPYISRVLSVAGNGKIAFATAIVSYLIMFSGMGIPTYGVKICASYRDDKIKLTKTVKELFIISCVLTFITYIVFGVLIITVEQFRSERVLLMVMSMNVFLNMIGVEWFYQAIEQYDYITIRNIVAKVISIILMLAFVKSPADYIVYGAILVVGSTGSYLWNFFRLKKYINFKECKAENFRQHFGPIILLFLYSAATQIYTNLDSVMLKFMAGEIELGYYNAAVKIKSLLVNMVVAFGTVLLPRVSYYLQKKNEKEYENVLKMAFEISLLLSAPAVVFFVIKSQSVILLLAGSEFEVAKYSMMIIMFSIIPISLTTISSMQVLVPKEKNRGIVIAAFAGAFTDVVLNCMLIPSFGANGAAIGTVFAEIVVLIIQFSLITDVLKNVFSIKDVFKICFSTMVSGICLILFTYFTSFHSLFLNILFSALVFGVTYFVCLTIAKEEVWNMEMNRLKIRIKR